MRLEPNSPRRANEDRRYFPDWVRRRLRRCEELEADRNSYLAGGYAEEFGYRAQPGCSRGVPVLDGEPPEQSTEWLSEASATHPGYPIRPHPIVIDGEQAGAQGRDTGRQSAAGSESPIRDSRDAPSHGTFFAVTDRPYERERKRAGRRAAAVLRRTAAVVLAWRWSLPRR